MLQLIRDDASRMLKLRHPGVLRLEQPLEETRTHLALVTEPVFASAADVLTCSRNASRERRGAAGAVERRALRARLPKPLPSGKYELGKVLCADEPPPCGLQPWARRPAG